jgi:biopolymer transport protein ExbD
MKFHRTVRPLRSQFDMAPFACVFFLLVMFLMLGSITYKPGVRIELPVAENFPGTDQPNATVTIDEHGQYYFQSQLLDLAQLSARLAEAVKKSRDPLTLVLYADKAVPHEQIVHLASLAKGLGFKEAWASTQPRVQEAPDGNRSTLQP